MSTLETLVPFQVFSCDALLSPEQCKLWIDRANEKGWIGASLQKGNLRNNWKCEFTSPAYCNELWETTNLAQLLPSSLSTTTFFDRKYTEEEHRKGTAKLIGLHNRLRIFRYEPNQFFKKHYDGGNIYKTKFEKSVTVYTLLIYLNDDFEGGATRIYNIPEWNKEPRDIQPKQGKALIFRQRDTLHEGCAVTKGFKYVIQIGVMYSIAKGEEEKGAPIFSPIKDGQGNFVAQVIDPEEEY